MRCRIPNKLVRVIHVRPSLLAPKALAPPMGLVGILRTLLELGRPCWVLFKMTLLLEFWGRRSSFTCHLFRLAWIVILGGSWCLMSCVAQVFSLAHEIIAMRRWTLRKSFSHRSFHLTTAPSKVRPCDVCCWLRDSTRAFANLLGTAHGGRWSWE